MRRRIFSVPLSVVAVAMCLTVLTAGPRRPPATGSAPSSCRQLIGCRAGSTWFPLPGHRLGWQSRFGTRWLRCTACAARPRSTSGFGRTCWRLRSMPVTPTDRQARNKSPAIWPRRDNNWRRLATTARRSDRSAAVTPALRASVEFVCVRRPARWLWRPVTRRRCPRPGAGSCRPHAGRLPHGRGR